MLRFVMGTIRWIRAFLGQIMLTLIFIVSSCLFFILYPLLSDPDYYKKIIIEEIEKESGLQFQFATYQPKIFPFPGLSFSDVTLKKENKELAKFQSFTIEIYLEVLFGEPIEIRRIVMRGGNFKFLRKKDESFGFLLPEEPVLFIPNKTNKSVTPITNTTNKQSEKGEDNGFPENILFSQIFSRLPKYVEVQNFKLEWEDQLYNRKIEMDIQEGRFALSLKERSFSLFLRTLTNSESLVLLSEVSFSDESISYESLRFDGNLQLENFDGYLLQDILVIFQGADFRRGKITGNIPFVKTNEDLFFFDIDRLNIKNVAYTGKPPFGDVLISTKIYYSAKESKLGFDNIKGTWAGVTKLYGSGFVTFTAKPLIYFQAKSDFIDIPQIIKLTKLWIDVDLEKSILVRDIPSTGYHKRMTVKLEFLLNKASIQNFYLDFIDLGIQYTYHNLKIEKLNAKLNEGLIESRGTFTYDPVGKLLLTGNFTNLNIDSFLRKQFQEEIITGFLSGTFDIESTGNNEEDLYQNAILMANLQAKEGALFRYTNILKPLSSLGNLISLKGIDFEKATPYKTIDLSLRYQKQSFDFPSFLLKANGLTISGNGSVAFDKKIDMSFTIALPGLAGRALKLPILYKGRFDKNSPFIDPIWLGSVYAGTIFLAGPAGATVGGIAGSAVSDYVNKAIDSATDTLKKGWGRFFSAEPAAEPNKEEKVD